jgi:hypothetical protein
MVEVGTARINAPVSTVLKEHSGKAQDGLHQLPVSILSEARFPKRIHIPRLAITGILETHGNIQQEIGGELLGLRAFVEVIGGNKAFEDIVEPIQEGDPVEKVASRERPSRWKVGEDLWKERKWRGDRRLDKSLEPRRLRVGSKC